MDMKIIPKMSEKSYALAANGTYVFSVPTTATKERIAKAIGAQYGVQVVEVNVIVAKGKVKRTFRKGGAAVTGKRRDTKKAYVRLAEGDKIALFTEEAK